MNEYDVIGWQANCGENNICSLIATGCTDSCCRSRAPKISLPYFILVHVCVKMIKDSVQQVPCIRWGCMYPKSRVYKRHFMYNLGTSQGLLPNETWYWFWYQLYLYPGISLTVILSMPHQTRPRDSAYPAVVNFETVIGFCLVPSEPDHDAERDERVLF